MYSYQHSLIQLTFLRFAVIVWIAAALLFGLLVLHLDLNAWGICSALLPMALLNLFSYLRLRSRWPITQPELVSQLVADLCLYGFVLYQSGGATNPFSSMLLIPLVFTAATLSGRYLLLVGLLALGIYTSLQYYYLPLIQLEGLHGFALTLYLDAHRTAQWLSLLLVGSLMGYFLYQLSREQRRQQAQLIDSKTHQVADQQLLSLATMAAGTAHELGTPLNTMQIVIDDLQKELPSEYREDLDILQQQLQICAGKLKQLTRSVEESSKPARTQLITELLEELLGHWQILRPEVSYQYRVLDSLPPDVRSHTTLKQALLNLLNNAADANPEQIDISLEWDNKDIWLRIRDFGPGIAIEQAQQLGQPFVTTKGNGLGIGLFLSTTTLASHDGEVRLYNAEGRGTLTEVRLARKAVHG